MKENELVVSTIPKTPNLCNTPKNKTSMPSGSCLEFPCCCHCPDWECFGFFFIMCRRISGKRADETFLVLSDLSVCRAERLLLFRRELQVRDLEKQLKNLTDRRLDYLEKMQERQMTVQVRNCQLCMKTPVCCDCFWFRNK